MYVQYSGGHFNFRLFFCDMKDRELRVRPQILITPDCQLAESPFFSLFRANVCVTDIAPSQCSRLLQQFLPALAQDKPTRL